MMGKYDYDVWLTKFGKAWSERNSEVAASLFSKDCKYFESVFDKPCENWNAIHKLWLIVRNNQKDVSFEFEIVNSTNNICIVNWKASRILIPSNEKQLIDGIFMISLDKNGLCNYFKQWRSVKNI